MTDKKGRIGILTGGGDIPGLNQAIRGVTLRALSEGFEVVGIRRGWAGLVELKRDAAADNSEWVLPITKELVERYAYAGGTFLHSSRTRPSAVPREGRPGAPQGQVHRREERPHGRGDRQPGVPRHRLPGAGRRRRHAQLRRRARPPRGPRRRHPQDDGQRRPRHRLLHGLRHLREPHHRDGPSGHQFGHVARAHRRARGLRPLRRLHGAAADLRRRRRPLRHPRGRVRHGEARPSFWSPTATAGPRATRCASSARAPCRPAARWSSWPARRTCSATPSSAGSART